MTFIQITSPVDFAKVDALDWFAQSVASTLTELDDRATTSEALARRIHLDLAALAAAADVDGALARQACEVLGATIAHAISDGVTTDDADADRLVRETEEDLLATIDSTLRLRAELLDISDNVRRLLTAAADLSPEDVANGEHHSDLFLAAATAVVAVWGDR